MMNKTMDPHSAISDRQAAALEKEAYTWLVRLRSQGLTTEDAEAFKRWCRLPGHAQAYAQVRETWRALEPAALAVHAEGSRTSPVRGRRSWRDIQHPGRRAFLGGAVAAAAAYVMVRPPMGLWPSVTDFAADYRTGTGEQREISLAGGAVVQLNTQTRINVRTDDGGASSVELLAGEAELDTRVDGTGKGAGRTAAPLGMHMDRVVSVVAAGGRATARDGLFNIRRDGAEVCLTCLDGQITLAHAQGSIRMEPGQQLRYGANRLGKLSRVDAADVSAWREGILVFKDMPLETAVEEINRYRPGRLVLMNSQLGRKRVQLRLSIAQLDEAADMIRSIYGAELTRLPGGVILLT